MRKLDVSVEINGEMIQAGSIIGNNKDDAVFSYSDAYIDSRYPSISISLPIEKRLFTPEETKIYFDGLLPEGFARKAVSKWIHASEEDYISILNVLGAECLGAIRISENGNTDGKYEKLSLDEVRALAKEGVSKSTEIVTEAHLSLTGASGKAGLYYDDSNDVWFKPIGLAPSTHIVKQSHVRLSSIVTNEQMSLLGASKMGIEIPESFIINMGSAKDEDILFATKRYDRGFDSKSRIIDGLRIPYRLHQEDFAQALGIAAADKYERDGQRYLEKIFNLLRKCSANPVEDQLKMWDLLIYDFLVGNTDNHIKNISLIYSQDLSSIRLAPAYDIVSTVIYPGSSRQMAIGIGGCRDIDRIRLSNFEDAAQEAGLSRSIAMKRFELMANGFEQAISEACEAVYDRGYEKAPETKKHSTQWWN